MSDEFFDAESFEVEAFDAKSVGAASLAAQFDADATQVPPGERVLVAVSSGADSLALLLWLHALGRDLVVGHVNHDLHELRAGDCERDEAWVRALCEKLHLPLEVRRLDLARKHGHVNEAVARTGRYGALSEIARAVGATRVATAHTATDGLETALLNLLRGAGPRGLAGFEPARVLCEATEGEATEGEATIAHSAVWLVRPLWRVGREALRASLRAGGWTWREDPSNRAPEFRRNRVRHEVLPLLAEIGGVSGEALAHSYALNAQFAREERAYVEAQSRQALENLVKKREENLLVLDGIGFRALPVALQRQVLRSAARQVIPRGGDLEGQKIEFVRQAVVGEQKRAVWTWRSDLRVEWTGGASGNRLRFWRV